jgi:tetratricopeptide (TPR) repeat protein
MPAYFRYFPIALASLVLLLSSTSRAQQVAQAPVPSGSSAKLGGSGLTSPVDASDKLTAEAAKRMQANDGDGALASLNQALILNPNNTGAYVLRASIYCQKKQWPQAENDFKAAQKIAPGNVVLKFNLIEVKFMQKQYDVARAGFLPLIKDPDMGDFAAYKVFLCDLFAGHYDQAQKELDVFNDTMGNPSYYFGNASWELVKNKNVDKARDWLLAASRIYPPEKNGYYAQSLRDLGYLPIPGPNDVVKPPSATPTAQ